MVVLTSFWYYWLSLSPPNHISDLSSFLWSLKLNPHKWLHSDDEFNYLLSWFLSLNCFDYDNVSFMLPLELLLFLELFKLMLMPPVRGSLSDGLEKIGGLCLYDCILNKMLLVYRIIKLWWQMWVICSLNLSYWFDNKKLVNPNFIVL